MQRKEKNRKREIKKILKKLNLSDYEYGADDENITLSAMAPQLVDFLNALGIKKLFEEEMKIHKRKSRYSSSCLSELLVLQNILGYDRIESSRTLSLDSHYQEKLGINGYPDPETFRDEWQRYTPENINQLFIVNKRLLNLLAKQEEPQYIDLHMDSKVITVYGDQENAEAGILSLEPSV